MTESYKDIFDKVKAAKPWYAPSKAVIAFAHRHGVILYVSEDSHVALECEQLGHRLEDIGLEHPESDGIWIWEGEFRQYSANWEHPQEFDLEAIGTYRAPTPPEWSRISKNEDPFEVRETYEVG